MQCHEILDKSKQIHHDIKYKLQNNQKVLLGQGDYGKVYQICKDHDCDKLVVKEMINQDPVLVQQEVFIQKIASEHGIAPAIVTAYQCDDTSYIVSERMNHTLSQYLALVRLDFTEYDINYNELRTATKTYRDTETFEPSIYLQNANKYLLYCRKLALESYSFFMYIVQYIWKVVKDLKTLINKCQNINLYQRDPQFGNFMYDMSGTLKMIDFGRAQFVNEGHSYLPIYNVIFEELRKRFSRMNIGIRENIFVKYQEQINSCRTLFINYAIDTFEHYFHDRMNEKQVLRALEMDCFSFYADIVNTYTFTITNNVYYEYFFITKQENRETINIVKNYMEFYRRWTEQLIKQYQTSTTATVFEYMKTVYKFIQSLKGDEKKLNFLISNNSFNFDMLYISIGEQIYVNKFDKDMVQKLINDPNLDSNIRVDVGLKNILINRQDFPKKKKRKIYIFEEETLTDSDLED